MPVNKMKMACMLMDKRTMVIGAFVLCLAFAVGVVIGYFGRGTVNDDTGPEFEKLVKDQFSDNENKERMKKVLQNVNTDNLRAYLKELTLEPHIAGHRRDNELIRWIKKEWENSGLDRVDLAEYDFYLSWPDPNNPNKIYLLDEAGNKKFTSHHKEVELRKGDSHPEFIDAFNAYAPNGTVEGQLVYVNYARVEDLRELEDLVGEGFLKGKICISRYGKIFRGNKVKNCQEKGAIGVILFSDPAEVAVEGTEKEKVYPNTFFLPGTGVQRGSTFIGSGDPLSPHWASVENAYRVEPQEVDGLPKIPAQPIGYDDAKILLEKMGGPKSPDSWKGKIKGIEYRIGGEMKSEFSGWKTRLSVNNYRDTVKSSNVIGYIKGSVEPDRYVMLSNHRDAWGFGSVDPSSGTAQLMEVVRSLGEMKKNGWRPRRTLVFSSWAAEESGLEGSYEFVYHHLNKIMHRTVAVLNTDICVSGPIAKPQASPMLKDVITDALKNANDPTTDDERSYYEFWKEWTNQDNEGEEKQPVINTLGSGTDHAAFSFYAGVPAINMRFKDDTKKHKGVGQYPMYHTGYETFYLMDKIIDPGFKIMRTCAQTSIHALLNMADSSILPFNLKHVPEEMKKILKGMEKNKLTKTLNENGVTLEHLEAAVNELESASVRYMSMLDDKEEILKNPIKLRMINDQMHQLERTYLMPRGLPDRPGTRHAIFAPGKFNAYSSGGFPAIADLLNDVDKLSKGSTEYETRWSKIKQHVSDLMIMVQSAARFLHPLDEI